MILWTLAVVAITAATYRTSYHQHYFFGECCLGFFCPGNCKNYHMA